MRILVANVNTTESMTKSIALTAESVAAPRHRDRAAHPGLRSESCEGNYESYLAAVAVMEKVRAPTPSRTTPSSRPGTASTRPRGAAGTARRARRRHHRGGRQHRPVPRHKYPWSPPSTGPCRSSRTGLLAGVFTGSPPSRSGLAVLELESDPDAAVAAIVEQAAAAVEQDRAEVICPGCGGMAGLTEQVVARTGVPVVDGVAAAVTIAESLVRARPDDVEGAHVRAAAPEGHPQLAAAHGLTPGQEAVRRPPRRTVTSAMLANAQPSSPSSDTVGGPAGPSAQSPRRTVNGTASCNRRRGTPDRAAGSAGAARDVAGAWTAPPSST